MFITISLLLAAACLLPAVGKLTGNPKMGSPPRTSGSPGPATSQPKDPDHDQVGPAKGHKPRSCRNRLIRPDRRSQHLQRVLRRYRVSRGLAAT